MVIFIGVGADKANKNSKQDAGIKYGVRSGVSGIDTKNIQETNSGVWSGVATYKKEETRIKSDLLCKFRFYLFDRGFFGGTEVFLTKVQVFSGQLWSFLTKVQVFGMHFPFFVKGFLGMI